jgi:N-acetylmuramoyl-L-alanine amidase
MIYICLMIVVVLVVFSPAIAGQSSNQNPSAQTSTVKPVKKLGPMLRADVDQVKKAQTVLKNRGFYSGDVNGRLNKSTREAIKKYQTAENMNVTGTLNLQTLLKMKIALTDKQKNKL